MRLSASGFQEELKKVLAWLPKDYLLDEVANILANLWLNPRSTPVDLPSLDIYQAKLRAELQKEASIATNLKKTKFEIPKKIAENAQSLGEALLIFLDGVQPEGIFDIEIGDYKLATCFCFSGLPNFGKENEVVAEVNLDFGLPQKQKLEILADQIVRIPLKAGFTAEIQVKTKDQFKLAGAKKISQKVTGGELGIVFDGRGRPIAPPGETGDRTFRIKSWKQSLEAAGYDFALSDFGFTKP